MINTKRLRIAVDQMRNYPSGSLEFNKGWEVINEELSPLLMQKATLLTNSDTLTCRLNLVEDLVQETIYACTRKLNTLKYDPKSTSDKELASIVISYLYVTLYRLFLKKLKKLNLESSNEFSAIKKNEYDIINVNSKSYSDKKSCLRTNEYLHKMKIIRKVFSSLSKKKQEFLLDVIEFNRSNRLTPSQKAELLLKHNVKTKNAFDKKKERAINAFKMLCGLSNS